MEHNHEWRLLGFQNRAATVVLVVASKTPSNDIVRWSEDVRFVPLGIATKLDRFKYVLFLTIYINIQIRTE